MITKQFNGFKASFFNNLLQYKEIKHFVTTRVCETGDAPDNAFNLSFNVNENTQSVLKKRIMLAKAMGIPCGSITTAKQVHGQHVSLVSQSMKGNGARDYNSALEATDAMLTNNVGICPMILVADCVPILLYDPVKGVVGAVHAGWEGTLGHIAKKTVEVFENRFGSSPKDMIAGIGPSIGPCCFQVGPEVIVQIEDAPGEQIYHIQNRSSDGSGYFDLWEANKQQLIESGLQEKNIEVAGVCTCCDESRLYFSHRGEKGKAGRFGAGIFIR